MRWRRLGIVAGEGALPVLLAEACRSRNAPYFVVRIPGNNAQRGLEPGADCGIAETGKLLALLKENACDAVVMAGIVPRPDFSRLRPDLRGAMLLPRVLAAAGKGDDAVLRVIVDTLEHEGFTVIGAHEVATDLAVRPGAMGRHRPGPEDIADFRKGAALIDALGPFDAGQAAVVVGGLVAAVEAAEGTDLMLARCAELPRDLFGGGAPKGVLVKRPKPGQEMRVDLPTIGPVTIKRAAHAGLAGVAVEAGRSLVIDEAAVIAAADAAGLFVYGFTVEELTAA